MNHLPHPLLIVGALAAFIGAAESALRADGAPPEPIPAKTGGGRHIVSAPVDPHMTAAEEAIVLELLSRPLQVSWGETTPLQVVEDLKPHVRATIAWRALASSGVPADTPLHLADANTLPLGEALYALLRPAKLSYQLRGNQLTLTHIDIAQHPSQSIVRMYDVTPLVVQKQADGTTYANPFPLMDALVENVNPSVWSWLGGPSTIESTSVLGRSIFTISTTTPTHLAIQAHLDRQFGFRYPDKAPSP